MIDRDILLTKFQIPAGYGEIINDVKDNLYKENYIKKVQCYSDKKQSLNLRDLPTIISEPLIESKEFLIRQTIAFSQASYFGDSAQNAPLEVKPLLYHYAENSLFSLFVYSILSYLPQHSSGHGLNIIWDENVDDIKIEIRNYGFFPRILDCYSICNASTHFSSIVYNERTKRFRDPKSPYPFHKEPKLKLKDVIKLRESLGNDLQGYYYDIIDFILLFFASSMARYRPYQWSEIARGETSTEYIWFNQCFNRFELLKHRILNSLVDICSTGDVGSCQLHKLDLQTKKDMKN